MHFSVICFFLNEDVCVYVFAFIASFGNLNLFKVCLLERTNHLPVLTTFLTVQHGTDTVVLVNDRLTPN